MLKRGFTRFVSVFYLLVAARDIPVMTNPSRQFVTRRRSVVYWYCTGTQFSKLSTAVDTSAAAACNLWCVCMFFLEVSHPADVSAPVLSGTSAFSLRLMSSRLTPGTTSALTVSSKLPLLPLLALRARRFHLPPPPRLLLYTPHVIT